MPEPKAAPKATETRAAGASFAKTDKANAIGNAADVATAITTTAAANAVAS